MRLVKNCKNALFVFIAIVLSLNYTNVKKDGFQVECVSVENDGYINIHIWDLTKGLNYKMDQARKDAIITILYSGLEGKNGCTNQLPLLNDSESQKLFKRIEKSFFSKKGKWAEFTRSADFDNISQQLRPDTKFKIFKITISKKLLQNFLVEEKIISNLSKGF